jgi:hypothetical protein
VSRLTCHLTLTGMLLGCLLAAADAPPADPLAATGLTYEARTLTDPRPLRVHLLRAELGAGKVMPRVLVPPDPDGDGPAETALTPPLAIVAGLPVLAFVNANPWDAVPDAAGKKNRHWHAGQPVVIGGLALSHGVERSAASRTRSQVWFDAEGRGYVGALPEGVEAVCGVEGFLPLIRDGEVVARSDAHLAPRTAIGVDRTRRVLYLLVVDGRQAGYSEGMSYHEVGTLMRELGCWEAAGMDGGGSTVMGLADARGRLKIVNRPSDRILGFSLVRPLPMVLTLEAVTP